MPYLIVNIYGASPPTEFDPQHVVDVLGGIYGDLVVVSNDALTERIALAQEVLSIENEAEATVLRRMHRDRDIQGPAISFTFTIDSTAIQGVAKRHLLSFTFDAPLTNDGIDKLRAVIQSAHTPGNELPIQVSNQPPEGPCRTRR